MTLQDAFYNWLSIKRVAEARVDDQAAQDTYQFFSEMLTNDHKVENIELEKDEVMYYVNYFIKGEKGSYRFPIELIDALLESIELEPKYNQ